jgi:hypothetical protein
VHSLVPTHRFRRGSAVIETDLPEELILLDPTTQEMFSLNSVGRAIWNGPPSRTLAEVVEDVIDRFAVSPDEAKADVRHLLGRLLDAGLVHVELR